jgi:hypothetical protein
MQTWIQPNQDVEIGEENRSGTRVPVAQRRLITKSEDENEVGMNVPNEQQEKVKQSDRTMDRANETVDDIS